MKKSPVFAQFLFKPNLVNYLARILPFVIGRVICEYFLPNNDNLLHFVLAPSDNGPVFSALDDMMLRLSLEGAEDSKKNKGSGDAKKALKNLLKSGIPGIEGMFGGQDAQPKVRYIL